MISEEDIQKNLQCMEEIKGRVEVIKSFLRREAKTGHRITDEESLCLQFRKVLELIALSSLAAHHQEYEKIRSSFRADWHAQNIIKAIEKN